MYNWNTKVRYIKTIGPTRAKELTKLGIKTVGDLLEKQPLSYIFPGATSIAEATEGQVVIKATIDHIFRAGHGAIAVLSDETGTCKAQWFNNPWVLSSLRPGMMVTFWGHFKAGRLNQPKWSTCKAAMIDVWGGQYGVHHATVRAALKEVLSDVELPCMSGGLHRATVFDRYHFPANEGEQQQALDLLKRDEAICLQLALQERRVARERETAERIKWGVDEDIMSCFPYDFTEDQEEALGNVLEDLNSTIPMRRLIHGEVGSGKSAIAFYAAMLAALNGKRTLILCPTTILADQHYQTLTGMGWEDVMLYTGWKSVPKLLPKIIISTHSLLNWDWLLQDVSLAIIDELQKFGVGQRAKATKHNPHLLLLSATPIPRTLAATVFGDLAISTIRELPIRRGTVITKQVFPGRKEAMYSIIERELAKNHQVYFVYPRISGDEDVASAEQGFQELRERFGEQGYNVGLLTGKRSGAEKRSMLRSFKKGACQILVSTIIAEVGLDNPNATVMCIMGADRFGLSQLHQLRGRVCRSTSTAFCFLVSETANPTSIARLEVIEKCTDGFEISEHDLRLRGAGEVFSTRQHGLPGLKWISLVDDYDLMIEARDLVAAGSVGEGPKQMMEIKYGESLGLGGVA